MWLSIQHLAVLSTLTVCAFPVPVIPCPFCPSAGQTLAGEVSQANLILYGTFANAKRDPNGEFGQGTTDLNIEMVIKDTEKIVNGKKTITLPRYVPPDPKNPTKFLIFCEAYKGTLNPYRGEAVAPDSKIAEYLKGSLEAREKSPNTKLKYFFNYLDSAELTISLDALMEFGNADYKEFAAVAPSFPVDTVVKWLKDPNTQASRYGLYGSMLGHCGDAKIHGPILKAIVEDPKKRFSSGMDGLLAGYIMLSPEEGWKYLVGLVSDTKNEFLVRYAALRTIRFFWDFRSDLIKKDRIVEAMSVLLDQGDIADLPMDDLRRWGRWELTERILGLYDKESHNIPIVRRAIIRFALTAPADNAKAAAFVARVTKEDPERVNDIRNLLELEKPTEKPDPKKKADPK